MYRHPLRIIPFVFVCLAPGYAAMAQLTVQNNLTPVNLVNTILVGQGITTGNITFNGTPGTTINDQIGSFNGQASNLGLNSGLVLATGNIQVVEGPNLSPSASIAPANPYNHSDPDLAQFVSSQRNLAVLEFDFIPTGDTLSFRFIFGSEEYPEYVCSQYNDGFGFFLSGPGINGTFTNNAVNLARVPGTTIPVAINTVSNGTPGALSGGPTRCNAADSNWQANAIYFVSNNMNVTNPWSTTVEFDGFTVPLSAGAKVACGQTYHIKIAIADATDPSLDSGVFIEGGSFISSTTMQLTATTPQQDGTLTEGCGEAMITVARPGTAGTGSVQLQYHGNSITAGDLQGNVAQVTIPADSTHVSFPLAAVRDGIGEAPELLTIVATLVSDCGVSVTDSVSITLLDYLPMELQTEDLWLACDHDSVPLQASVQGGLGPISLGWGANLHAQPHWVTGFENGTYTVYATDQCPETQTAQITVHAGCDIVIPNVITPNGDGMNDAWVINGLAKSGSAVKVFNRWGILVYESANYGNNWKAKDLPDGTYFYEVMDGRTGKHYAGYLTILANGHK